MRYLGAVLLLACGRQLPTTTGDACDLAANTTCDRAIACANITSNLRSTCVAAFVDSCCATRGKCNSASADPDSALRCVDALAVQGCGQNGNGLLPSLCIGIPGMWQ